MWEQVSIMGAMPSESNNAWKSVKFSGDDQQDVTSQYFLPVQQLTSFRLRLCECFQIESFAATIY